jgi:hypothetical protein
MGGNAMAINHCGLMTAAPAIIPNKKPDTKVPGFLKYGFRGKA